MMLGQPELIILLGLLIPIAIIYIIYKVTKGSTKESSSEVIEIGEKASFSTRFVAYFFDGICVIILASLLQFLSGGRMGLWFLSDAGIVIVGGLYFTYYFGTTWQTVGKKWMKIKVVSADGSPMTITKGFLRYIGYIISGAVLQLGFLWILLDKEDQGWHDKIAKTYVVKA